MESLPLSGSINHVLWYLHERSLVVPDVMVDMKHYVSLLHGMQLERTFAAISFPENQAAKRKQSRLDE